MRINTNTHTIQGDHNGIPFVLEAGVLKVNGVQYSLAELRTLMDIANLLKLEGHEIVAQLPVVKRRMFGSSIFGPTDQFGFYGYDTEDER